MGDSTEKKKPTGSLRHFRLDKDGKQEFKKGQGKDATILRFFSKSNDGSKKSTDTSPDGVESQSPESSVSTKTLLSKPSTTISFRQTINKSPENGSIKNLEDHKETKVENTSDFKQESSTNGVVPSPSSSPQRQQQHTTIVQKPSCTVRMSSGPLFVQPLTAEEEAAHASQTASKLGATAGVQNMVNDSPNNLLSTYPDSEDGSPIIRPKVVKRLRIGSDDDEELEPPPKKSSQSNGYSRGDDNAKDANIDKYLSMWEKLYPMVDVMEQQDIYRNNNWEARQTMVEIGRLNDERKHKDKVDRLEKLMRMKEQQSAEPKMSRIAASTSRLAAPSFGFRHASVADKRKVLTNKNTNSPAKRMKKESFTDAGVFFDSPSRYTRSQAPITGRASFHPKSKTRTENVPPTNSRRKSLATKKTSKSSVISKSLLRPTVVNKTTSKTSLMHNPVAKTSLSQKAAIEPTNGRKKRAAWDVKGRLLDMEAAFKDVMNEKEEYSTRIKALEQEKRSLNQNLEQSQTTSLGHQDNIDKLKQQMRRSDEESSQKIENMQRDIKNYKGTINDLEFKNSTLERRVKSLDTELSAKEGEVSGLKATISQMSSAHAGTEALLTSTKQLLSEHRNRVKDLEDYVSALEAKIEDLTTRLADGETIRKKLHNQVQELKGNIRVFCRLRPLLQDEKKANDGNDNIHHINILNEKNLEVCKGDLNSSSMSGLKNRGSDRFDFSYDHVFGPKDNQESVFNEIQQLVQSALDGYNVCVFAYGQTGSGKTYTMEGKHGDATHEGMIPRTVKEIFTAIDSAKEKGWTYSVAVNILEIYNETIRDLLASKGSANLTHEIKRVDKNTEEIIVTNLTQVDVESEDHVHSLLKQAKHHRAVAATNINEHSSRSHCIFQLKIKGIISKSNETCEATLSLVDLAGSERLKESGAEGQRLTETQNINKSLSNLGNVMLALGQKSAHIPYRSSKLTHLLINSLGGNSKTLMFVNLSPLDQCFNETLNSLRFATKVNQCHIGTATKQIKK